MKKNITSISSFKRILDDLSPAFVGDLLAIAWKVVAAVHCFFRKRSYAAQR